MLGKAWRMHIPAAAVRSVRLLASPLSQKKTPGPPPLLQQPPCPSTGWPRLFSPFCSSALAADILEDNKPLYSLDKDALVAKLEDAVEAKDSEQAWKALQKLKRMGAEFPERIVLKDFLALLATKEDVLSLYRAHKVLSRLNKDGKMDYVDGSLLGSLGLAFAKANMFDLSASSLRLMIQYRHYPSLVLWKSMMEHWVQKPFGAVYVVKIFLEICIHVTKGPSAKDLRIQGTRPDMEAFNIALRACGLLKQPDKAEEIFALIPRFKFKPDNTSFCSLIKAYEKGSNLQKMRKILLRMKQTEVVPNSTTVHTLFTVCLNIGEIDAAAQILLSWGGKVEPGSERFPVAKEDVLSIKDKAMQEMLQVYELIRDWSKDMENPCEETYTLLLQAFLKKGRVTDAASFLQKLCHTEESDHISCSFAFNGMIEIGLRDEVHSILKVLEAQNTPADSLSYAMLVNAYCNLPQPLKARAVLEDAKKAGHLLDAVCYASLIDAYNLLQEYDSACLAFQMMKQHQVVPLEPAFKKAFLFFEKHTKPKSMLRVLQIALKNPSLKVDVQLLNRTIRTFGKAKQMVAAKSVVRWMRQKGIYPDTTTYNYLLNGYIFRGGKTNELLLLWDEVKRSLHPLPGSNVILNEALANGFLTEFVKSGHYKKALDVIAHVEERNLWVDKEKFKNMYKYLDKGLYGSKHNSKEVEMSDKQREQINAFKLWVGLGPP